jgi:hypothetical protein
MNQEKPRTYSVMIKYNTTGFEEIANFISYEKAIDRLQTMLVFFKIPHSLAYSPKEQKEFLFWDNEIGVGLALKINK